MSRLKAEYISVEEKTNVLNKKISVTIDMLNKAESIQQKSTTELAVFQKQLNERLTELKIDISTLKVYETQDSVDTLLLEAIVNQLEKVK